MSKEKSDVLFLLIKSLKKSEKRYFKVFVNSENDNSAKKYVRLFDLIDHQKHFDDNELLKKDPDLNPAQLSNLKSHLYKKILQSIRQYNQSSVIDIQIREMIDYAQILFNRSLYDQCASILKKAKKQALKTGNLELQLEILKWEKNVINQTVGQGNQLRVNRIIEEVQDTNNRINNINIFTNLSAKLNALYLKIGFIRNESDFEQLREMFNSSMPSYDEKKLSLDEKLNLYNLYVGYYFFIQDIESGYLYARKCADLFDEHKQIRTSKIEAYIRALNNLLIAQYKQFRYYEFVQTSRQLREIRQFPKNVMNENIRLRLIKYTYVHEFNRFFMLGDFDIGVALMKKIQTGLEHFTSLLDNHSKLIMYYKTSCLYFGNGDYNEAIFYLNRILNSENVDIREDVHSFARILNLISHYELGNVDVIDYYIRSTYRFLLKKDDLHNFQKYILNFLKKLSYQFKESQLIPEFIKLRSQLLSLKNNPYEKRAFVYFDIIEWLESKIQQKPVAAVIKEKAMAILKEQRNEPYNEKSLD
ncbi:hypothetical protein [Fulvivirga sediminis]|uniref:Tetratricopeptide repeat protein n=1 Tax=Fulvivirga sediminis TaxID=2803949 RepID=A0A937F7S0_9BACT|nr:hypothetical protein [Fulvivirga sediminis]MBL3656611.1 hypothetical protein [Fulvivirga sediminis]